MRVLRERGLLRRRLGWEFVGLILSAGAIRRRGLKNLRDIRLSCHDWRFESLPEAFSGTRILHISDLHLDVEEGIGERVAGLSAGLEYDFTVITGDFQDSVAGHAETSVRAGIDRLRSALKGPVFFVLGNHDSLMVGEWAVKAGMLDLCNSGVEIAKAGGHIFLGGVDDAHYYKTHDFSEISTRAGRGFSILLSHSPEIAKEAEEAGFDFMLSGHTHGGQICLPGGIPISTGGVSRRLSSGRWRVGSLQGFTSRGLGGSLLPLRYNCPPELAIHRLLAG